MTGCDQRINSQPRAKTGAQNVRKLLQTAVVPVPEEAAEALSLAKTMVSEYAERDVLKAEEEKIKIAYDKTKIAYCGGTARHCPNTKPNSGGNPAHEGVDT